MPPAESKNMPQILDTLHALHHLGPSVSTGAIAELLSEFNRTQVSTRLCRMRDDRLVESELAIDRTNRWTMTDAGLNRLNKAIEGKPEVEVNLVKEAVPPEGNAIAVTTDEHEDLLIEALEIETALDRVRSALQRPVISARAARVYSEILNALPEVLQAELAAITEIVEGHSEN